MCGYTRIDIINNGVIRDLAKVTPIEDKIREKRLKLFDHVKKSVDAVVRRYERINIPEGKRGKGRLNKSLDEVLQEDFKL